MHFLFHQDYCFNKLQETFSRLADASIVVVEIVGLALHNIWEHQRSGQDLWGTIPQRVFKLEL